MAYLFLQAEDGFVHQLSLSVGRNPILLLPIAAYAIAFAIRRARRFSRPVVIPQSAAPNGVSPAESGMLLYERIGAREVAATLVDLAVKKYLSIADETPQADRPVEEHDLVFHALRSETEWKNLAPHEAILMRRAFSSQGWARFSQLRQAIPEIVPAMEELVTNALWEKGIYRSDPDNQITPKWKGAVYVFSLMGMLWSFAAAQNLFGFHLCDYPALGLLMIGVTMGIVVWAVQDPPRCSARGVQMQAYLEGLRQFIAAVDTDRLHRLERYRFDELLPYAMVFGIEQKWVGTFQQLGIERLSWAGDDETDSVLRGRRLTVLSAYLPPLEWKKS